MTKFKVVAYATTRHEIEIEAKDEYEARDKVDNIDISDWIEDMEYYEFEINSCEEIKE
jgi:hypothetical protein